MINDHVMIIGAMEVELVMVVFVIEVEMVMVATIVVKKVVKGYDNANGSGGGGGFSCWCGNKDDGAIGGKSH